MYKLNSVKKNIIVDTITPVSIYLKLRDNYSNTILLESSDYSAKDNSYAYICCNPIAKFYVKKNTLFTEYPDGSKFQKEVAKDIRIFSELEKFMNKFNIQDDSNLSSDFDRNYLRNEIFPMLEKKWNNFSNRVSNFSKII